MDLRKGVKRLVYANDSTMQQLAKDMGVVPSTLYSAISNGNPRLSTMEKIADALGVSLAKLIEESM